MKKIRKGKKGFTFIELLAVIAIIGILATVTVVSVNGLLASSRRKYYQSQENTTVLAGKEYFTDYRSELPKNVGEKEAVTVDTLYTKKYLSELKDHNGNSCTNIGNSKVYSQKITATEYQYYSDVECNGYSVNDDTKAPVITFSPDKKVTNGNITVTMTVTDNSGVASYYYEIEKDNVLYKKEEAKKYTSQVDITFTEEGTYVIKAHAIDTKGNIADKTSNKYVIDRTAPDCSKIDLKSATSPKTWQNKDVKIKVIPHSDIAKWSFRNCFYQSNGTGICKDDGKAITGTSTKTLAGAKGSLFTGDNYTDNGHVYGKVIAYDEAGNSCSVNTSEYYIDKNPPSIKNVSVTSRNSNYHSLYVTVKFTLTDRIDTTGNKIYYSVSESGSVSWKEYTVGSGSVSVNLTLSGSYNGKLRRIYIKAKDELGNTSTMLHEAYIVYNECSNTYSSTTTGSCSTNTGFGTATETKKFYDKFTNNYCSSSTNNVKCCVNPATYYGNWSNCNVSCGGGTKSRSVTTYKCDGTTSYSTETASCNTQSCTCSNVYYRDGNSCSASCGSGTYNRLAYDSNTNERCYSKDISYGGASCTSYSGCPAACSSVYYRDGSTCSNSCGSGTYNRLAYDSYTNERCYSKDISYGGASCSSTSGCAPKFTCNSVGSNQSYAGKSWTVVSNSGGQCKLALNSVSSSTGSYYDAYSKLYSEYFYSGSTLRNDYNSNLITSIGTDSSGASDISGTYWKGSGTIYDSGGRPVYSASKSAVFYGGHRSDDSSDEKNYYKAGLYTQPSVSYYTSSGSQSATNSSTTYSIANAKLDSTTANISNGYNYHSLYLTQYAPADIKKTNKVHYNVSRYTSSGVDYGNNPIYSSYGNSGNLYSANLSIYACGGYLTHGYEWHTLKYKNSSKFTDTHRNRNGTDTYDRNLGSVTYRAAGYVKGLNEVDLIHHDTNSTCISYASVYSLSTLSIPIHYRLTITINTN